MAPVSGHVFRCEGKRRRCGERSTGCPTGARSRRRSGRRGPSGGDPRRATSRGAPPGLARDCSRRRAPGRCRMVRTGVTFADACDEYLRYVEYRLGSQALDGRRLPLRVRAHLVPVFGSLRLEGCDRSGGSRRGRRRSRSATAARRRSSASRNGRPSVPRSPAPRQSPPGRGERGRRPTVSHPKPTTSVLIARPVPRLHGPQAAAASSVATAPENPWAGANRPNRTPNPQAR